MGRSAGSPAAVASDGAGNEAETAGGAEEAEAEETEETEEGEEARAGEGGAGGGGDGALADGPIDGAAPDDAGDAAAGAAFVVVFALVVFAVVVFVPAPEDVTALAVFAGAARTVPPARTPTAARTTAAILGRRRIEGAGPSRSVPHAEHRGGAAKERACPRTRVALRASAVVMRARLRGPEPSPGSAIPQGAIERDIDDGPRAD